MALGPHPAHVAHTLVTAVVAHPMPAAAVARAVASGPGETGEAHTLLGDTSRRVSSVEEKRGAAIATPTTLGHLALRTHAEQACEVQNDTLPLPIAQGGGVALPHLARRPRGPWLTDAHTIGLVAHPPA